MNDLTKNLIVFVVIIVVLLSVVQGLSGVSGAGPQRTDYSEFLRQVRNGNVERAEIITDVEFARGLDSGEDW